MPDTPSSPWFIRHLPLVISGLLLSSITLAYALSPDFRDFLKEAYTILTSDDEARISAWVNRFGWRGPLLLIAAMIVQIFMLVIPSWILMVVSVLAYGPFWGTLLSLTSTMAAAAVAYGAGKYIGDVAVESLIGQKNLRKAEEWVKQYGFWAVVLARISPVVSGDAVSLVSGVTEMPFGRFIGATLAGAAPMAVAIGFFGDNTSQLKEGFWWISGVSAAIFVGYLLTRKKKEPAD